MFANPAVEAVTRTMRPTEPAPSDVGPTPTNVIPATSHHRASHSTFAPFVVSSRFTARHTPAGEPIDPNPTSVDDRPSRSGRRR
jgi:hypothetical protein